MCIYMWWEVGEAVYLHVVGGRGCVYLHVVGGRRCVYLHVVGGRCLTRTLYCVLLLLLHKCMCTWSIALSTL